MTAAAFDAGREASPGHWIAGGLFALAAHCGMVATALSWQVPPPPAEPPAAVMIELAPLPVAPVETPSEIPPGPKAVEAPPPPPPPRAPEPEKIEEPPPPPPEAKPQVVLFKPPPKPRPPEPEPPPEPMVRKPEPPKPNPPEPKQTAPRTTAPPTAPAPKAEVAASPLEGRSTLPPADAMRAWQSILLAHLERFKRYPSSAQARRLEGVAYVRFVMDPNGAVLSAALARGSGHGILDEESRSLVERAAPLPKPPPELAQARIELIVPVQFHIR